MILRHRPAADEGPWRQRNVSAVLAKIGVSSRTAAALEAAQLGIGTSA